MVSNKIGVKKENMKKEFEGKKLLVLGGVTLEGDIVRYAQNMGAYVIVADYDENSPAKKIADKAVLINALDVDAIVKYCIDEGVDGITTGFVDILLEPCYEACKRLNLPCYITPKMLSMSTNKIDFKNTCCNYDVPVPRTYLMGNHIEEETYKNIKFPVFVKPLDGSGSRGAGVCRDRAELSEKFAEAISLSASGNAIIEDYITGRDFLLDYMAVGGEFRLLSIFDRYMASDRGSAVNYSNIAIAPSHMVDFYLNNINDKVISMFKSLGFTDGLFFLQGYYNNNKVTFFEMGCRLGGSYYNHQQEVLGYNAVDMIVRYALTGSMVEDITVVRKDSAKYEKYALDCNYLLKGTDETVARIEGIDAIKSMPTCIQTQEFHGIGYHYGRDKTVDRPIFVAEVVADSKSKVIESVNFINKTFDVFNKNGDSLLMDKLDPNELFEEEIK